MNEIEKEMSVQLFLSTEKASALALFLKRLDSGTVRQKAASDFEAEKISAALAALRNELAQQGFDPR